MGASVTQLNRLNTVRNNATTLCNVDFVFLQCRHYAAVVGLFYNYWIVTAMNSFKLSVITVILHRSSKLATSIQPNLLAEITVYNSLDIYQQSFLGSISRIRQDEAPACLRHDGWLANLM